ncbi:DUF4351 domain-containing protein [Tolypothrix bouteillei VB521301]|uniref:DUF4351 domain-containing protein n=1 Tax=Tolypothrix bouteillei VB521301 TaxID=1479485 RepID=A0A8S9T4W2_9CYAN|nr:DUF4351 domain-containing protein [Tolypothrix bouteillei VB521301]
MWIPILLTGLEAEFWQEFKQFEQERRMSYITTGERIGYERGKQEGKLEGRLKGKLEGRLEGKLEGEQLLILRLLQRRVGTLPEFLKQRIQTLSTTQLETLAEALLDFTVLEDLLNWLEANQS